MLVTESLDGELRSRPMAVAKQSQSSGLFFLSRVEDEKVHEIEQRPNVNVVMQRRDQYVSISGHARLVRNLDLQRKCWTASARIWFPQGSEDPNIALLCLAPTYAESWDRTGIRKLEFWWKAFGALMRKEKASVNTLSGHTKLKF